MKTAAVAIIGYTLKARADAESLMPEFTAPSNYGPDKALEYVRNKKATWLTVDGARSPYSGTVASATAILLPTLPQLEHGDTVKLEVGITDATTLSELLRLRYESLYDMNGEAIAGPLRIIGFDPRTLVKIVGLEAAEKGVPIHHEIWYAAEHRDIESAVCPDKSGAVLKQALRRLLPDHQELHDHQPFVDATKDTLVTAMLTMALRLVPRWNQQIGVAVNSLLEKKTADDPTRPKLVESPLAKGKTTIEVGKPKKKPVKPGV